MSIGYQLNRPAFSAKGACRGHDTAIFYPGRGELTTQAKQICESCPVRAECLVHALEHEKFGIWGGASERARQRMRRSAGVRFRQVGDDITEATA